MCALSLYFEQVIEKSNSDKHQIEQCYHTILQLTLFVNKEILIVFADVMMSTFVKATLAPYLLVLYLRI